jgi:Kef-type K+ transport system membrane component KefB
MNHDEQDWLRWRDEWGTLNAGGPPPAALRRMVERDRNRAILLTAGEVVVTLVLLALVVSTIVANSDTVSRFWATSVVAFLIAAWAISLATRRGLWRPESQSTDAFVALLRERRRRGLQMIRAALMLTVLQSVFGLAVTFARVGSFGRDAWSAPPVIFAAKWVAGATLVVLVWSVWYRRRLRAQIAELDRLTQAFNDSTDRSAM